MNGADSFIFRRMSVVVFFIVNLFAIYLLFRGHNLPGGGFIAGVCSAIALILLSLGRGLDLVRRALKFDPMKIASAGMAIAIVSSAIPLLLGDPFLTTYNYKRYDVPVVGDFYLGTPLFFDLGVFLAVVGMITKVVFVLAESTSGLHRAVDEEESCYCAPAEEPIEAHPLEADAVTEGGTDAPR